MTVLDCHKEVPSNIFHTEYKRDVNHVLLFFDCLAAFFENMIPLILVERISSVFVQCVSVVYIN